MASPVAEKKGANYLQWFYISFKCVFYQEPWHFSTIILHSYFKHKRPSVPLHLYECGSINSSSAVMVTMVTMVVTTVQGARRPTELVTSYRPSTITVQRIACLSHYHRLNPGWYMLAEPPSNRTLERPNRVEKTPDNDTIGPSKKKIWFRFSLNFK